jgi:RNA polymerase sigma-70 factor (TIGR02960 family)
MDTAVLERARTGDQNAFAELVRPCQAALRLHCYRMLGSLPDTEDAVQETLLSAWRGLGGFAERASVRTWLYRIATHRCLNIIRDGRRCRPSEPVMPFDAPPPSRYGDVPWLQPLPEAWLNGAADPAPGPATRYELRESVQLAFVAALQQLPPRQTAALLLCDVLGYSTTEAAGLLDTTATAVKGALQRARAATPTPACDSGTGHADTTNTDAGNTDPLADRFAEAFVAGDIERLIALLSDDAWLAMPPAPHEYLGRDAIAGFLTASFTWRGARMARLLPVTANLQPGFACYLSSPSRHVADPTGIFVLTIRDGRIHAATRFQDPSLVTRFGMPASISLRTTDPR